MLQTILPNPELITWCRDCGTLSVGKAEIVPKSNNRCDDCNWEAVAPFNGVHGNGKPKEIKTTVNDTPTCPTCYTITKRMGTCFFCYNCNTSTGCS